MEVFNIEFWEFNEYPNLDLVWGTSFNTEKEIDPSSECKIYQLFTH